MFSDLDYGDTKNAVSTIISQRNSYVQ